MTRVKAICFVIRFEPIQDYERDPLSWLSICIDVPIDGHTLRTDRL